MPTQNHLIKAPFDPSPYADRVEELLNKMTVAEKVGQINLECVDDFEGLTEWNLGSPAEEGSIMDKLRRGCVGAVICRGFEKNSKLQQIAVKESRLGIPLLFGYDVIHGHRTIFPIPLGTASTWDPSILEKTEEFAAKEAYADGINWVFAPMIDLCRDPRWGRVAEGAGEDPLLASLIAQAKVKGFQTVNPDTGYPYVAAGFKHYCGYGLSEGGRDYDACSINEQTFMMDYMKPYAAAVDAGAMNAMSSFNVLNGEVVTASRYYLTEILRENFGFGGFVVSDYGSVAELIEHRVAGDLKDAASIAITAGVDMDMASGTYLDHCEALYNEDSRFAEAIDEAVRRILSVKFALGLFEHPYNDEHPEFTASSEGIELAREVARKSAVLLENKNGTLPLDKSKKYLLLGQLADSLHNMIGTWALCSPELPHHTVKGAMEEGNYSFAYHIGYPMDESEWDDDLRASQFDEVLSLADECDGVIFVCGEPESWSGECSGSATLEIPRIQTELLRKLKENGHRVTSVLMCGRAVACRELSELSDALLLAWHNGSEGGAAVCDCIFGDCNPSGRLPITFPYHVGQIPIHHALLSSGRPRERYGRYRNCTADPLYPFGYGLSYSEIRYNGAAIDNPTLSADDTLRVRVEIENLSDIPVCETVQAYFKDNVSSVPTPERKLCGFAKAELAPHSKAEVALLIPASRFALMTRDLREIVESGEFTLFIGHDSTCKLSLPFTIE